MKSPLRVIDISYCVYDSFKCLLIWLLLLTQPAASRESFAVHGGAVKEAETVNCSQASQDRRGRKTSMVSYTKPYKLSLRFSTF